ncbi:MAG: N-acetylmuramoyl-L-alanine amidase [bacterium]|nr:N-acetylmuramoyl-L-alanine amidase [bacterium]
MRHFFLIACIVSMTMSATTIAQARRGSLYGWVVVLDSGHGGMDPGASGIFQNKRVVEDEYVFDVTLRVRRMIQAKGGLAIMTTTDKVGERSWKPFMVFPDARTERFTTDGSVVRAGAAGLRKRLRLGNQMSRKYPKHHQAWISIHFDVRGRGGDDGVRIIAADTELRIAKSLERSFGNAKRLRDDDPIVESGDRDHGVRRLFVLSGENRIKEKVLIELGNFKNEDDVWRIRNPAVREAYARAITEALVAW